MSIETPSPESSRRRFVTQVAVAATSLISISPLAAHAQAIGSSRVDKSDAWMKHLRGKHRQIFHATGSETNAMLWASNFLTGYRDEYGAKPGEVNAVIGLHGGALMTGFNDSIWSKYVGKTTTVIDPGTKQPAQRNIFAADGPLSVAELQKRGIVFIICNTALRMWTTDKATTLGVPFDALYAEVSSSRLPGTFLIPSMMIAINRAQEKGFTYVRAS